MTARRRLRLKAIAALCTVSVVALLIIVAIPPQASARSSGEFWTYSAFSEIAGVNASGPLTFQFLERTNIMLGSNRYDVDKMRISGEFAGSGTVVFIPVYVNETISGTVYVSGGGMTLAKEDASYFVNTTRGPGSFPIASQSQTQVITTYIPPYLGLFSPSKSKPGDAWSESISVNTTTIDYQNGTVIGQDSQADDMTISVDISSTQEQVTTPAGTFKTLKLTVSRAASDFTVYWWSSSVGNIVAKREFSPGPLGTPQLTSGLTLSAFESETAETFIIVVIGVIVAVVAVVIIAAILTTRKRPGLPARYESPRQPSGSQPPGQS